MGRRHDQEDHVGEQGQTDGDTDQPAPGPGVGTLAELDDEQAPEGDRPRAGDVEDEGRGAHLTSVRLIRHNPIASGSASHTRPDTTRWPHSLPEIVPSSKGAWAKLKSIHGRSVSNQSISAAPIANGIG